MSAWLLDSTVIESDGVGVSASSMIRSMPGRGVFFGPYLSLIHIYNNLGGIALNQGRLDDALLFYRRALRSLEQIGGSLYVVGAINLNLGATHVRRGETTVAFEHLERARELFSRAKAGDLLPEMHRRLAEAHLLQGATADARREAETSLATAEELSMMVEQGLSRRLLGVIAAEEARVDEAERHLQEAIQILTDIGDDYGLACAQLSLAELLSLIHI